MGEDKDNFVITHVRAGTAPETTDASGNYVELKKDTDYKTTEETDMRSFNVAFTITPAEIQIHLAEQFAEGGSFVNSFVYNNTSRKNNLSSVFVTNEDSIIPLPSEYSVTFEGTDETVTNAGAYYLNFVLESNLFKTSGGTALAAYGAHFKLTFDGESPFSINNVMWL